MAPHRTQSLRRPITIAEMDTFIHQRVERQQAAKKKYTLQFEVAIEADGRISNVAFQPVKERIEK